MRTIHENWNRIAANRNAINGLADRIDAVCGTEPESAGNPEQGGAIMASCPFIVPHKGILQSRLRYVTANRTDDMHPGDGILRRSLSLNPGEDSDLKKFGAESGLCAIGRASLRCSLRPCRGP
ncbi:MAG: hypothetical protein OXC91_09825 [Rhodobacteraceae bacterium]|nr:hypothetical protein [Paracoccaceae bacterium]